jgi:hypothetical protein
MPMTPLEVLIYKDLKSRSEDTVYIAPDGLAIYALTEGGMIVITSGLDLKTFSDEEINEFIVAQLT